ncbi:MAG TPA: aspartyl/asparaginyl beta-hydroxylase domain-containing protein [Caulobacteraceae bacterium]|jgi:aspartyl/asparaginyl beta-hydroxylase (cupin superfamily)|nr:aspartyl/asparaginyl beta-hydroxylase domain-containing protein [Caulobacteraceae bacterium]
MTDPINPAALADEAGRALWAGDFATAIALYEKLIDLEPRTAGHRVQLALAHRRAGDRAAELGALDAALALEPRLLTALLLKGVNLEERGQLVAGGQVFRAALAVAPPFERLPMDLRPLVRRAQAGVARFQADFEAALRQHLAEAYRDQAGEPLGRFNQSLDVMLGKKSIYRQHPNSFYFAGLSEAQFYERERFPWLTTIEQASDRILAEFEAVWRSDHGAEPYIAHPPGAPVDQWAELNHSPRWSAFHLVRNGAVNAVNADRCPETMALLDNVPAPTLAQRSPNVMFSVLQPRTRIPPHTGETNARLVVHIPLIIPERTGFRVGNDARPWRLGEAFVFNDTIEHEAWNDSDHIRAVLIFDIWHPELTPAEQVLVERLMEATNAFLGRPSGGL